MSSPAPAREIIPPEMDQHRVAWLTTRDTLGRGAETTVRFATDLGKIYSALLPESVALEHIREQPEVKLSLGRGNQRVRGPEISGLAYVLLEPEAFWAKHLMVRKYWWLRVPFLWNPRNVLIEITLT